MNPKNLIVAGAGVALLVGGIILGSNMGKNNSDDAEATAAALAALKASSGGNAGAGNAPSAKELAIKQASDALAARLGLSDEQKTKAAAIVEQRVGERMDAVTELAATLEADPSGMMETILAGDALKRGEITQEEYDAIAGDTLAVMRNVSGFAFSGRGGNDLTDPLLAEQLQGILTPEQQQQLAGIVQKASEAQAKNPQQLPFQNGNLPAMELEKLDQTMASAQKLTTGLKAMMEGLQGMRDLAPPQNGQ